MLTAFRSNTPSFASCNKVTNLVVSSPRLFSCLLGVCGCSESPTAPSSPLLLADSSSIITRDQLRTSPPSAFPAEPSQRVQESDPPARQQTDQNAEESVAAAPGCFGRRSDRVSSEYQRIPVIPERGDSMSERSPAREPLATRGMTGQFNRRRDRLQIPAPIQKRHDARRPIICKI